ncbi:MAG: DinB family protein [Bacteroidota bacterium]
MDKAQIGQELVVHHQNFIAMLRSLSDEDFQKKPGVKWTAGQQLDHIVKSVKPIDMAFGLPMFVLKMKFGLSNRPSKTYEALVSKYQKALEDKAGFEIPSEFAPSKIPLKKREKVLGKMDELIHKLRNRLAKFSEGELDTYILPHPLMGKLTLREMLYFTIYHVQHHHRQIPENLAHANPKG